MSSFTVKHQAFEGPLELLLDLIEKRKLFVSDIALSQVTDDYINHVKNLGQFPVADSAQFILVASTLLLIKSKSLLPSLDLTSEEQADIHDLERRLALYQKFREISRGLHAIFGKKHLFSRRERRMTPVFSPDETQTLPNLVSAMDRVLNALPKKEFLPKVIVDKVISLEEMIGRLTERVTASLRMSFREFASVGKEGKVNVIISFLAMLELVKQGMIQVVQERHFDDITMETEGPVGVPKY
ncbi:MAG: ScpA family protein [Candidatus Paceibacterota bacterium]|jgi:segregation and condensation protein A